MPKRAVKLEDKITVPPDEDAVITAAAESDPDNPIWTDEDFARARPAWEVVPELVEQQRRKGHPRMSDAKATVTLRLSVDVLAHFRLTGPEWQTRIDDTLRKVMELSDLTRPEGRK